MINNPYKPGTGPSGGYPGNLPPQGTGTQPGYQGAGQQPQGGLPQGAYPGNGAQQPGFPQGGYAPGGYMPPGGYPPGGYPPGGYPPGGQYPPGMPGGPGPNGGPGGGGPGVPGQLPLEQSYVENILRLNLGKIATIYMTFENNSEWNAKVFRGRVEAAGRDHIIISDPQTGMRYLLLMVNFDYATFEGELNYSYPYGAAPVPTRR